jgi:transcription-repair coupling factor (superfamily II helicase)
LEDEDALNQFRQKLRDRFGPVPEEVEQLFHGIRLRKNARRLGFEKISVRNNVMRCFTIDNPESKYYETDIFNKIIDFVSKNANRCMLKQNEKNVMVQIKSVYSLAEAVSILQSMNTAN